jgi:hypothetical protein
MVKFNSRKFIFGAFIFVVSTAIFVFTDNKLTGDHWVELIKWTSITYFITNAISKKSNKEQ